MALVVGRGRRAVRLVGGHQFRPRYARFPASCGFPRESFDVTAVERDRETRAWGVPVPRRGPAKIRSGCGH